MMPGAVLCHASPGRLRIRIAAMRGDHEYFRVIEQALSSQFPDVAVNSATGSLLVKGPGISRAALERAAAEHGLFELEQREPMAVVASSRPVDVAIRWPEVAAGALAALAVVQALRGRVLAPAVTLAWYAAEALAWSEVKR
jgi:hypothetical protein